MANMDIKLDQDLFKYNESDDGELSKAMIYKSAPYVVGVFKANLQKSIGRGKGESKSKGALLASVGLSKMSKDKKGFWNLKIGFSGKDENGVRNGLKAGVLEHGKSNQTPRPFAAPTARQVKSRVAEIMQKTLDEEIEKRGNT